MNLLVIAYPELSQTDMSFIEKYRRVHDPLYNIVKPHFTFVFPVHDFSFTNWSNEIKKIVAGSFAFPFTLQHATVNKDDFSDNYFTFLIPKEGNNDFVKLHDKLYSSKLAIHHRRDLEYIPHITICKSEDKIQCKMLADELNKMNLDIKGVIKAIDIVNYENGSVESLEKINLKQN